MLKNMKLGTNKLKLDFKRIICKLNVSYANVFTCHRGDIVKWHTDYMYNKFHSHFRNTVISRIFFIKFVQTNAVFVVK